MRRLPALALLAAALTLAGCASFDPQAAVRGANASTAAFTGNALELRRTGDQRLQARRVADELLGRPLDREDAVRVALANSPALQALLAERTAAVAQAAQTGRLPNPVFSFERLAMGPELEIGRLLSFGLLDVLTLPQRIAAGRHLQAQASTQLATTVVEQVSQVRQAWIDAVAAQQLAVYAAQVQQAADASAELARRMQQAGNFSKLERARQHAFYADATAQLASAQHAALAAREQLVRLLGLDDEQAQRLKLPERLPDLPAQPQPPSQVNRAALEQRLDWQLARQQLDAAASVQGLNLASSYVDVELGLRNDTVWDAGARDNRRGWEAAVRLPLFDAGDARRAQFNDRTLAAASRLEAVARSAGSQLRESYSAYRTAWELARHWRDEIVPLRQSMAEENLLRYNAMLVGVFELLADTREQVASVMGAIRAQQQFWQAEAALASAVIGRPAPGVLPASAPAAAPAQAAPH